jgi:hypothetical protein
VILIFSLVLIYPLVSRNPLISKGKVRRMSAEEEYFDARGKGPGRPASDWKVGATYISTLILGDEERLAFEETI